MLKFKFNLAIGYIKQGIHTRYFYNLITTFLSQAVNAISVLCLTPVLIKNLGIQKFGVYGVILNIVLFSTMLDLGLNTGLLRRLINEKKDANGLINSLFFFFTGTFLVTVPLVALLHYTSISPSEPGFFYYILFASILFTQNILILFFDTIIQTSNKIYVGKIVRMVKLLTEFALLYFLSRYKTVVYLLEASLVLNTLYVYVLYFFSKREVPYIVSFSCFKWSNLYGHIKYSFWYFQNAIANVLVFNAQVIMISSFLGTTIVAKYLLVTRFFDIVRIGLTNFTQILFPSLAVMEAKGEWMNIRKAFKRSFIAIGIMVIVAIPILLTIGKPLFILWSKQNDAEILHVYSLFSVFILLIVLDNVSSVFLAALKLNKLQTILSIIQGVLGLVLGYILMKREGIAGVVIASLIALLITNFVFNPLFLLRKIKYNLR